MRPDGSIPDAELDDIWTELTARSEAGSSPEESVVLRSLYADRLYEKRSMTLEALYEATLVYIGLPEVQRQHPCLMDACEGRPDVATKYVLWWMLALAADGIERGVEHCMGECERAFSRLVVGGARLHE